MATVGSSRPESTAAPLAAQADPEPFPFRCELSLAPLITFWTQLSAYHELGRGPIPGLVRERARTAPELTTVIHDESLIEHHRAFVDLIMSALFPLAFWEQEYGAALYPFQLRAFYATPPFRRSLMSADGGRGSAHARIPAHPGAAVRDPGRERRPGDLHDDRVRHGIGPALPAAVRLALRRGRARRFAAAAPRAGAAAAPDGRHRRRATPHGLAARPVHPSRLHDCEGRGRDRPGGPVLPQARPD